jgi:uncharacterized repeat protein (TIGR03803 family)
MKTHIKNLLLVPALIASIDLILAGPATAQTFTTLYSFTNGTDGAVPDGLVLSGNTLYGTTTEGGKSGYGTLFALSFGGSSAVSNPVVTWDNPASITYGTPVSSTQLDATANVPGSFAYSPSNGTVLNVGTNALSVLFTPTDTVDYSSVTDTVSLVVSPAPLTVTAANTSRLFDAANPVFIGTITGLMNGDDIAATYSTTATSSSPAGTYPIVPSLVDPNDRQTNYTVNLVDGTLTVNPPQIVAPQISANPLLASGNVNMTVSGLSSGVTVILEGSPDLITWTLLQTNTATGTTLSFSAPLNTTLGAQFLRVSVH